MQWGSGRAQRSGCMGPCSAFESGLVAFEGHILPSFLVPFAFFSPSADSHSDLLLFSAEPCFDPDLFLHPHLTLTPLLAPRTTQARRAVAKRAWWRTLTGAQAWSPLRMRNPRKSECHMICNKAMGGDWVRIKQESDGVL